MSVSDDIATLQDFFGGLDPREWGGPLTGKERDALDRIETFIKISAEIDALAAAKIARLGDATRTIKVRSFHRTFDHPVSNWPVVPPEARVRFRLRLIAEEFCELMGACLDVSDGDLFESLSDTIATARVRVDLPDVADALADLSYVSVGTEIEFGIDGEAVFDLVHRANMAKLGPDGRPIRREDGKTLKPSGWSPPDVAGELRRQGWKP